MPLPTFVYIDYGPSPDTAIELKYSLATLLAEYAGREPEVVVYTDKPEIYSGLHPNLRTRVFNEDFATWSRKRLYAHRVKPCVLNDALETIAPEVALVDADTFFRVGFAEALARVGDRAAMDHFERRDPCPACAGIAAQLPHAGRYVYDPATAAMFNSGLVAARARHKPILEDAVALIDAWLDAGVRQFNLEQIALSESFRIHGEAVAEMKPAFAHYYRRSQRLYMKRRLSFWLERESALKATRPFLEPSKSRVRLAHIVDRLTGRV